MLDVVALALPLSITTAGSEGVFAEVEGWNSIFVGYVLTTGTFVESEDVDSIFLKMMLERSCSEERFKCVGVSFNNLIYISKRE